MPEKDILIRKQKLIVVFILLLILITRLIYINNPPAEAGEYWRQPDTESIARNFIKYEFNIFYPQFNYDGPPPNYVQLEFQITTFLIAILYKIFGYHIWLARIIPVIFFMISVYYLYLIAKKFFSPIQTVLTIIIYSFLPLNIFFSRAIMPEAALLCFFNGAFYYFLKWLDDDRFPTLMLSAIFTALAISQKPQASFLGLAMIALCCEKFKKNIFKKWQLLIFLVLSIVPNIIYFTFSDKLAEQKFVSGIAIKHIFPQIATAMISKESREFIITKLPEAFGIIILLLSLVSLLTIFKKKERPILYWAIAMGLEVILIVSVIKFEYYMILLTPIVAILSGKLLGYFCEKNIQYKIISLILLLVLVVNSYASTLQEFQVRDDLVKVAKIIDNNTKPDDLIIIGAFNPVLLSLSNRSGWRANLYNIKNNPQTIVIEMNRFLDQGADYFYLYQNYIYNDNGNYVKYLNENYPKINCGNECIVYYLN